eukprot:8476641-Pyramimonas_sp.AAC.1
MAIAAVGAPSPTSSYMCESRAPVALLPALSSSMAPLSASALQRNYANYDASNLAGGPLPPLRRSDRPKSNTSGSSS